MSAIDLLRDEARSRLQQKGIPPGLTEIAIRRAENLVRSRARGIREEIRDQAIADMLALELAGADDWARRTLTAATSYE